jgi:hypothetical protein
MCVKRRCFETGIAACEIAGRPRVLRPESNVWKTTMLATRSPLAMA